MTRVFACPFVTNYANAVRHASCVPACVCESADQFGVLADWLHGPQNDVRLPVRGAGGGGAISQSLGSL